MRFNRPLFECSYILALSALAVQAHAVTTYAQTYVGVSGSDPVQHGATAGAAGAVSAAALTIAPGTAFMNAEAVSLPGSLHAVASARGSVPTVAQANALATWADSFTPSAQGRQLGELGTFSGAVTVSGGLFAEILGQAYADAFVVADLLVDPHTGFNGGFVRLQGGGRHSVGYDTGDSRSGQESFTLFFDAPFTVGQSVDISMRLTVVAAATPLYTSTSGDAARALADYGHTMTWDGLTNVRDSSGALMAGFSAVSDSSGYNFVSSVPEPSSYLLMVAGLGLCAQRLKRLRRP